MAKDEFGGTPVTTDEFGGSLVDGQPQDKPSGFFRRAGDTALSLAKGVIGAPEAAVGLADLVTGGQAGKLVESAGIRFKDAKSALDQYLSPEQQAANKEVQDAKGFFPTIGAMVSNPSTIVNSAVESAPSMLVGGAASRGAMSLGLGAADRYAISQLPKAERLGAISTLSKVNPIAAGAIGEGAASAGQNAEQVRQEDPNGTLTAGQSAILAASGVLTGAIGFGAGKVANKLGIGDAQTMIAAGKTGAIGQEAQAVGANKGFLRKVGEGFANEGILQELPQSYQEQVAQNIAQGKPWDEGAAAAGAAGLMAGGAMGIGANIIGGYGEAPAPAPPPVAPVPSPAAENNAAFGFNPQSSPAVFNFRPTVQPTTKTPSQAMGIDRAAGTLSDAAGLAVDTGITNASKPPVVVDPTTGEITNASTSTTVPDISAGANGSGSNNAAPSVALGMGFGAAAKSAVDAGNVATEPAGSAVSLRADGPVAVAPVTPITGGTDVQNTSPVQAAKAEVAPAPAVAPPVADAAVPAGAKAGGAVEAPTRKQATDTATSAASKVLENGGSKQDAMRAATDALIDRMASTPDINIAQDGPAAVLAATQNKVPNILGFQPNQGNSSESQTNKTESVKPQQQERPAAAGLGTAGKTDSTFKSPSTSQAAAGTEQSIKPVDIKTAAAKLIPNMSDAEVLALKDHYGPDHKRGPKIAAEIDKRGLNQAPAATKTITSAAPKTNKIKQGHDAFLKRRSDYFTPGNIVKSYSGHDEVVSYAPTTDGKPWSVDVRSVVKQGNQWVADPKDNRVRRHSTEPSAAEIKNGPVKAVPVPAAIESVATKQTAPKNGDDHTGIDNTPLTEGGKPFKTQLAAQDSRKLQPDMRVVRIDGGFALASKTAKQIAAQEKAGRRLSAPNTSPAGEPIPAHAFIAAEGGLNADTYADMNVGSNPAIGNRRLFAGSGRGLTMEQATERLVEEGYLGEGAGQNEAMALIKRSLTNPQYTSDGIERIAEMEEQSRFDAYEQEQEAIAVQQELEDNQFADAADAYEAAMLDYPAEVKQSDISREDAFLTMGFTEQEYQNAIADESRGPKSSGQSGLGPAEVAAASGAQSDSGRESAPGDVQGQAASVTPAARIPKEIIALGFKLQPATRTGGSQNSATWTSSVAAPYTRISVEHTPNPDTYRVTVGGRFVAPMGENALPAYELGQYKSIDDLMAAIKPVIEKSAPGASQEGLTSPTQAEVLAQQERDAKGEKANASQRKAEQERLRLAAERKDISKASEAASDSFVLGGDAEQNLSGQGGMFDAPQTQPDSVASQFTGQPDPKNSAPMQSLGGFKVGDVVDVPGRTIGQSVIKTLFTRQSGPFGNVEMADIVNSSGKSFHISLIELTAKTVDVTPAPAAKPAQELGAGFEPVGARAFAEGKPRTLPTELRGLKTGSIADEWYAGYDRAKAAEPAASTESKPAAAPAASTNTIFTKDAADAARARLKAKLGRLNSGIDPETLMDGITLAGYHIESGARTFAAYAKAMLDDLGDGVKPYLKSWYAGVAYDPRATSFKGMDSMAVMDAFDVDSLGKPIADAQPTADPQAQTLSASLAEAIARGDMPKDNPALKKLVEAFDGKPVSILRMKDAQEALESGISKRAREIVAEGKSVSETYDALLALYASQPNLNIRTSTSINNQAYSTPAPLAFLASKLADVTSKTSLYEPTAGNGMLTIGANPKNVTVNELDPKRLDSLKTFGFREVLQGDALKAEVAPKSQDRVMTNPPFGSVKDAKGSPTKVLVDGFKIGQIDHLIAARALETMKDNGKATLILGANKVAGILSTDDRIFFNWLYSHYNVTGHFEVDGKLYSRQGAAWPVRVISIDGRVNSNTFSPIEGTIQRVNTWTKVYEQFSQINQRVEQSSNGVDQAEGGRPDAPVLAPGKAGQVGPTGSTPGIGDVSGTLAGNVPNQPIPAGSRLGAVRDEQRLNAQSFVPKTDIAGAPANGQKTIGNGQPGKPAGTVSVTTPPQVDGNEFQVPYTPSSSRKDAGVLIPSNMADPLRSAMNRLEDEVGNIDEYARKELGYSSVAQMHGALMGLQVDSVAMAIYQIKQGKAVVIADQTGIGKGRQAAAIVRWAERSGHVPVFVSVKPELFTDIYSDLADIGTTNIKPFVMNSDAWVSAPDGTKLFANKPALHGAIVQKIGSTGKLPVGTNAVFLTYSQINKANKQRAAIMAIAPNAVFVLDESHNAAGESATGNFVIDALGLAKGVTYLSATYAKRPDNMPLYFKTDIGSAAADTDGLASAMAAGGLPLQTVVSNNLVKAGQMFRRERSYAGITFESKTDTANSAKHEAMSDTATSALRSILAADKSFHSIFVGSLAASIKAAGATVIDNAGNQISKGVEHTEFSSVVHNFVKQMLLGLKAQTAANEAIAALKRGEKPVIALENTMGSFLAGYVEANGLKQGDSLRGYDYRTVLSRALERTRVINEVDAQGNKVKRNVELSKLDPVTRQKYKQAQEFIDTLSLDIPASPIDWMRAEITKAGYSIAEITGRDLAVDYTDTANPVLSSVPAIEQTDKVNTTRQFNGGKLDSLILNVAGSTGISLHASEKFADQRQRYMIVAQAAGDINTFMQMLGRINRTGQTAIPKYAILSVALPAEKRPTAVLSGKMKSLNANTSSNTESATSVKTLDILNKYGDQLVNDFMTENMEMARELGVDSKIGTSPMDDIARMVTGRLALQPIAVQKAFYEQIESSYEDLINYLNKTNQNELEPKTFNFDAKETRQEVLFNGPDKNTPFGEDAIYGEYSIKAQGVAMTADEINAAMAENLDGKTSNVHNANLLLKLIEQYNAYGKTLPEGQQQETARQQMRTGKAFFVDHAIGKTFRVDINTEPFNAVITNIRSTHKSTGNPFAMSKIQLTVAVNGALRSLSVPATQFRKIEVSAIGNNFSVAQLFKAKPLNERETAKIITGNLLAAYGEIQGTRGTIINFTKADNTIEQGILLPKVFNFKENTKGDYRLESAEKALTFLQNSEDKDIGRFGIMSRDGVLRVLPSGQGIKIVVPGSKLKGAKYFLDAELLKVTGDFASSGQASSVIVQNKGDALAALEILMKKQALYTLPSMAEEAKALVGKPGETPSFSRTPADLQRATDKQAEVQAHVDSITAKWANAPAVVVVRDMQDTALPEKIRQADTAALSNGATGTPEGVFYQGTVYLIADQINSRDQALTVLAHEALGHFGLRGMFGTSLDSIKQQIATMRAKEVLAKGLEYGLPMTPDAARAELGAGATTAEINRLVQKSKLYAAEEVLAEMAQTTPNIGFVQRAVAAIRTWLRQNVPSFNSLALTDNEIIRSFILPARGFVVRGEQQQAAGSALAFSRSKEQYPRAGVVVDGRTVRDDVPNMSSIASSLDDYKILKGVREVPMSDFTLTGKSYSVSETNRIERLANSIKESGEINPLIVVQDREGSYVLEGGHRAEALFKLGAKSFPAVVVQDNESFDKTTTSDNKGAPMFSRSAAVTLTKNVTDKLNETFNHPGKVSWWHNTIGSMYNLAERSKPFKRVFESAQSFINDTAYYATEAADMAPKIIPKLETISDIRKQPISFAENKAIAAPIFEGTLNWARNEAGKPVLLEDLQTAAALLTNEQKGQRLLRSEKITENVLKMWQAMPIEQYSENIESSYEMNMLRPGVVWTDAELRNQFKLDDANIGLYREFRQAVDRSLENTAKAKMLSIGGKDTADLKAMVMDAPTAEDAAILLRDHYLQLANEQPERANTLIASSSLMIDQADMVNQLKERGYAPLSRFGRYTVDVVTNGERKYFSLFESQADSNRMAEAMGREFGKENVAQGTLSQKEFELFQGVTPDSLELFGNMLGLESQGNEAKDQAFQKYIALTKNNNSAMKRLMRRKGVAGYSEDVGRVLAGFIYSNARQTSAGLNMSEMNEAITDIPKLQGELKDIAIKLADYVKNPQEEAQAIRGVMFAQYLGGSVASAFVNLTQPMAVSFPYLSQFGGAKQSAGALISAIKDMSTKNFVYEKGLANALKIAEERGVVSPQEVHQLMAQARGNATLFGGDGTKLGEARAKAQNGLTKFALGWGKLFGLAEQINRRSTFIAAYRIAIAQKISDPAGFAAKAVNETQFINNKGNKMQWGRGAVGATLMTFKSYSFNYLELLHRMATQSGPEGKKAAALMLGMLVLMAGTGGLPFEDDLTTLVDFVAQRMGYNFSGKQAKQEFLEGLFGKAGANFVDRGISGLPGSPIDSSQRMSMGHLVPGLGAILQKRDTTRDVMELLGPMGDMVTRTFGAASQAINGDFTRAALTLSPKAIGNAAQGLDMANKGMYRDQKGFKVLDTTPTEAAFKAIGFQPASVSMIQESNYQNQRAKDFYSLHSADIRARWAKGIFENDPAEIQSAKDMMNSWNEKNPDQRINPNIMAVMKKVGEMRKTKDQRINDTAPLAMRAQLRKQSAEDRALIQ